MAHDSALPYDPAPFAGGDRPVDIAVEHLRNAKTSAAAAFALVFGVSALLSAMTGLLAPLAVILGLIGLILGVVGIRMARRPAVTGKGVAIGAVFLSVLALLLGSITVAGVVTALNNQKSVDRIEKQLERVKKNLPTTVPTLKR